MHSGRGWAKGILFEYQAPLRVIRDPKAFILLDGMPTVPSKRALFAFLSMKGHWVFHPRYRGSWESEGEFLKESPDADVRVLIDQIEQGFANVYDSKRIRPKYGSVILLGSSFGAAAAILASRDSRVEKAVALAPMIDWNIPSTIEPIDRLHALIPLLFGRAYRAPKKNWVKLGKKGFFNPIDHAAEIDGKKLLIIHEKSDRICPSKASARFAKATGAAYVARKGSDHLSLSRVMDPVLWKKIRAFIAS